MSRLEGLGTTMTVRRCADVVRTHHRMWKWLWQRRIRAHLAGVVAPFIPMP